jgi:hypothetical protein
MNSYFVVRFSVGHHTSTLTVTGPFDRAKAVDLALEWPLSLILEMTIENGFAATTSDTFYDLEVALRSAAGRPLYFESIVSWCKKVFRNQSENAQEWRLT